MGKREDYEQERENALWRSSVKRMFQSEDIEGLMDLKEGPESLDDEIIEFIDECIEQLKNKLKGRSQAD